MFYRHVFGNISGGFRSISRKNLKFAGLRPRELSEEALSYPMFEQPGLFTASSMGAV